MCARERWNATMCNLALIGSVLAYLAHGQGCASSGQNLTVGSVAFALSPSAELEAAAVSETANAAHTAAPLHLEVWATVHGTAAGPLFADMDLHSGDSIGLQARTSSRAHVYLLHCDGNAVLSVFPASGSLVFPVDRRVELPAVGAALRLSDLTGNETLFIVASKRPLENTDPALHDVLLQSQRSGTATCGGAFESLLAGSSVVPTQSAPPKAPSPALRGVPGRDVAVARAFADQDGVVVLKLPYRHLP